MLDLALLAFIAVATVAIGSRLVAKNFWLILPVGFLAVIVLRVLSAVVASVANRLPTHIDSLDVWVFVAALAAFALPAIARLRSHLWSLAISIAVFGFGEIIVNVLHFFTRSHGDALWILALSDYISQGGTPTALGTSMSLKRGFALILMLGTGEGGNRIDAFVPIIFMLVGILTLGFAWHLLRGFSRAVSIASLAAVSAVVFTATMPLVAIFYVNGHTMVALGITTAIAAMLVPVDFFVSEKARLVVVCLGLAVVTMTRPEGALLALVVVAIFAARYGTKPREVLISIASVFAAFLTWMYTVDSYVLAGRMTWLAPLAMLLVLAIVWALYRWAPNLMTRVFALTPLILFALFLLLEVVFFNALKKGDRSLVTNLFFATGGWGYFFWGLLFVVVLSVFINREAVYGTLLRIAGALAVASFLAKMVDGGQFGSPTLGRVGWDDSLNRMWIHFLGIFFVLAVVGVAGLLTNDFVGLNLSKLKDKRAAKLQAKANSQ